jgi:NhaP-type Na+/H+ or K+/H+ antiporter
MYFSLDSKDIFYIISGLAFLAIKVMPSAKCKSYFSAPMLFIIVGSLLSFTSVSLPLQDILTNDFQRKILEHFTELIVIISLAGAGLAIDRKVGLQTWKHTWVLLLLVMPLTIVCIATLGYYALSLPLASAFLLAAVLAPTDPVLARSVQVDGPNTGEENDVNVSLTSEAGMNDGLAFPFIYLAIMLASTATSSESLPNKLINWLTYDLGYRVFMGIVIGAICGIVLCYIMPKFYQGKDRFKNDAALVLMSLTFISYGVAEMFSGYGFLAVFIAALSGKKLFNLKNKDLDHAKLPHMFSEQFEKILVALLLLWLGYLAMSKVFLDLKVLEVMFALGLVLIIRPVIAYLCLMFTDGSKLDHFAISFLGIRGIGSLYYLAYAQNHENFQNLPEIWRITILVIICSIFLHGITAQKIMKKIHVVAD